jgi:hypothetical protein
MLSSSVCVILFPSCLHITLVSLDRPTPNILFIHHNNIYSLQILRLLGNMLILKFLSIVLAQIGSVDISFVYLDVSVVYFSIMKT